MRKERATKAGESLGIIGDETKRAFEEGTGLGAKPGLLPFGSCAPPHFVTRGRSAGLRFEVLGVGHGIFEASEGEPARDASPSQARVGRCTNHRKIKPNEGLGSIGHELRGPFVGARGEHRDNLAFTNVRERGNGCCAVSTSARSSARSIP